MIQSMTGFGKSVTETETKRIIAEIRSLNSKSLDLSFRLPSAFREKETVLRTTLGKQLQRGKADLTVQVEKEDGTNYAIDTSIALSYHKQLKELAGAINETFQSDYLSLILKMPEVIQKEKEGLEETDWEMVEKTIHQATGELIAFRKEEGGVLEKDLKNRIYSILELLKKIEAHEPERMVIIRKKLSDHLEESVVSDKIDRNRLEQELIYYIEKLDITEEKVRLKSHCDYFLQTMETEEYQGKKLGFIGQEIGREINTIGSKANHAEIQRLVVEMKDELERIKEQVLNVL